MPPVLRYEVADFECSIIQPLLPNKPRGVPRVDDRKVIDSTSVRVQQHAANDKKGAHKMVMKRRLPPLGPVPTQRQRRIL